MSMAWGEGCCSTPEPYLALRLSSCLCVDGVRQALLHAAVGLVAPVTCLGTCGKQAVGVRKSIALFYRAVECCSL